MSSRPEYDTIRLLPELQEITFYYVRKVDMEIEGIDIDTEELLYSSELSGLEGEEYTTAPEEIEHYKIVGIPDNQNGIFDRNNIKVTYLYKRNIGKVEVIYKDEDGTIIKIEELSGRVGDSFEVEEKEFDGYEIAERPEKTNGEFTEEDQTIVYVLRKSIDINTGDLNVVIFVTIIVLSVTGITIIVRKMSK